jgi:uroporphyrinogen III methyltransferase/synthase
VSFITGHEDPNKAQSAHNWAALAKGTSTLVFFMGVKNLDLISNRLIENGLASDTPVALVRWGTTCEQESLVSTLKEIPDQARQAGLLPPALLVVGQVVRLHEHLNWFEKKTLLGCRVVVTRAREQASSFLSLLRKKGACCLQFPTIAIDPLPNYQPVFQAIKSLAGFDWLIFTSVNGVKWFWKCLSESGLDARALGGLKVAAIGPATAQRLQDKGIEPDFVPKRYVAEDVVQGLIGLGVQGKQILLPRAKVAREVLPEALREAGAKVQVLPVYQTQLADQGAKEAQFRERLQAGAADYVTFTSSSTVENFFERIPAKTLAPYVEQGLRLACIGPITAATLQGYGFTAHVQPDEYTIQALAQALAEDYALKHRQARP